MLSLYYRYFHNHPLSCKVAWLALPSLIYPSSQPDRFLSWSSFQLGGFNIMFQSTNMGCLVNWYRLYHWSRGKALYWCSCWERLVTKKGYCKETQPSVVVLASPLGTSSLFFMIQVNENVHIPIYFIYHGILNLTMRVYNHIPLCQLVWHHYINNY